MNARPNVLIQSLDERWAKYRAELRNCKREFSQEAVHDLRVATRRLLAVMDILRLIDPQPRVQKVRRLLKSQLDALDELRDTQVMLVEVFESLAEFPDLKDFEEHLLSREMKLLRKTRKEIKASQPSDLKKRVEKIRSSLEENVQGRGWTARLLSVVDQAYARAMQAFGQVEASQPASIHRFRVAFKKFRYMVEVVHPALKGSPEAYFKQMHDYQSRMGDVQDAVVFLSTLVDYAEQTGSSARLASVQEAFDNQRLDLITKFMDGKEELSLFWRAAPDQSFSWEKKNEPVHRSSRDRRPGGNARIRRRQPASTDRQGEEENGKHRAGAEESGSRAEPDPHQSLSARGRHGQNPAKGVRPGQKRRCRDGTPGSNGIRRSVGEFDQRKI
jgi:CHAD domain-containing protein